MAATTAATLILAGCDSGGDTPSTPTSSVTESSTAAPTMATPTPTPTPTALPASTADDAVNAMLDVWNVALSMPADATETPPDVLTAIDDITVDDSDAQSYLQAQALQLTLDGLAARGDIIGVPLDDFESDTDTFTVTACLSLAATSVADPDQVVATGTFSAYDLAGTVTDGQLQLDTIANVGTPDPADSQTPVPIIDDEDPSEPAPDACVPPDQESEILDRADGFIDAFAAYRLDTSDQEALAELEQFTVSQNLLSPFDTVLELAGLIVDERFITASRSTARVAWCQDPDLNAEARATQADGSVAPMPQLLWLTEWEESSGEWILDSVATYGPPERNLLVPHGWEQCFES